MNIFNRGKFLKDSNNAKRFSPNITPPRLSFNGFVEFVFSPQVQNLAANDNTSVYREQISSLIQTSSLPAVSFNTVTKKQYNMKRIVQTGVEYNPIEMTVLDTVNNEWLLLFMKYFSYSYMNPRNKVSGSVRDATPMGYEDSSLTTTKSSMFMTDSFNSNAAGYNLSTNPNFFDHIKIVMYHAGKGVEYILFKPTITSFDMGELNYAASDVRQFRMSFEYESFTINNSVNFDLNDEDKRRFEKAFDIKFQTDTKLPLYMNNESGTPVTSLGSKENNRPRTGQQIIRGGSE